MQILYFSFLQMEYAEMEKWCNLYSSFWAKFWNTIYGHEFQIFFMEFQLNFLPDSSLGIDLHAGWVVSIPVTAGFSQLE